MISGFQAIGETGNYQIDSTFKNLALDRKGVLYSQQYTAGETTNTSPTRVQLTLLDGELLALACTVFCSLGSRVGNVASVYVDSAAGAAVEYYIFKPGSSESNFGLQVFNENSELTFDTSWKLFDVRSIMTGFSSLNLAPNKKYAFIQCQIQAQIYYAKVVVGQQPNTTVNWFRSTSFSSYRINNNLVECAISAVDLAATRPQRVSSAQGYSQTYNNGVTPQALILDVTGY